MLIIFRAILDMKNQRDRLHQYQRRITVLTDKETDIAKQMLAKGDKKRALLALRRKKYQESLLAKTDAQLAQLEKLTNDVEFALIQKDVVFGLQQGTKVLKEIHAEMGGIENVEKLMGETAEAIAYQQVSYYNTVASQVEVHLHSSRKLAICSEVVSRTKTSKRWKTNWKPSKPNSPAQPSYPPYPWRIYQKYRRIKKSRHKPRERSNQPCWQRRRGASETFWIQAILDRAFYISRRSTILRLGCIQRATRGVEAFLHLNHEIQYLELLSAMRTC